jgi:hypothetical protein
VSAFPFNLIFARPFNSTLSILGYLLIPKVTEPAPKAPSNDVREREHISRLSALSNFSIGDMFRDVRDGSKSVKFPEKLMKVLEQRLQDIAMGKDAAYVPLVVLCAVRTDVRAKLLGPICPSDDG